MLANYYARDSLKSRDDDVYVNQSGDVMSGNLDMNNYRILNIGGEEKDKMEIINKNILAGETGVFIVKNSNWKFIVVNIHLSKSFISSTIPREFINKEIVLDVVKYYKNKFRYKIYAVVKIANIDKNGHFDLQFINAGFRRLNKFQKRVGDSAYFISSVIVI